MNWQISLVLKLYRLKTIDKDGSFVYSSVVFISFADLITKMQVNPNPVRDGWAKVSIYATTEQQTRWKLIDNSGRMVLAGMVQLLRGLNSFSINTENHSAGIYLEVSSQRINQKIKLLKL